MQPYKYDGYTFTIKREGNIYTAKSGYIYTYDETIEGLKNKIEIVVHQDKNFKLSVNPVSEASRTEKQQIIDRINKRKKERAKRFFNK